jgi:hypothetical protein
MFDKVRSFTTENNKPGGKMPKTWMGPFVPLIPTSPKSVAQAQENWNVPDRRWRRTCRGLIKAINFSHWNNFESVCWTGSMTGRGKHTSVVQHFSKSFRHSLQNKSLFLSQGRHQQLLSKQKWPSGPSGPLNPLDPLVLKHGWFDEFPS